jgi:hypothetical protein
MIANAAKALAALVLMGALVALGLSYGGHVVRESDRAFTSVGLEGRYRDRPFSGVVYARHSTGWPSHLTWFWRGVRVGVERLWYDDGAPMAERPYRNGKPHGAWRQWYQDGSPKSLKTYDDGVIDGEVWDWHANGVVADFDLYERGREITHKSWVADGTPHYNYVYQNGRKVGIRGGSFCKRLSTLAR